MGLCLGFFSAVLANVPVGQVLGMSLIHDNVVMFEDFITTDYRLV